MLITHHMLIIHHTTTFGAQRKHARLVRFRLLFLSPIILNRMTAESLERVVTEEKIDEYIQKAQRLKVGIYSPTPEKSQEEIALEISTAKDEFQKVITEEKSRVNSIVEEETMRLMALQKENETDITCPICLELVPVLYPLVESPGMMPCCGAMLCNPCSSEWQRQHEDSKEVLCFACRRSAIGCDEGAMKEMAVHGGKRGKGRALCTLAEIQHRRGEYQKAFQSFKEAVKLGDSSALAYMASSYYTGEMGGIKVQKSIVKAEQLAQQGADQGHTSCYTILAELNLINGKRIEHLRLLSIVAYQGVFKAKYQLAIHYIENWNQSKNQSKKDLILGIYWSGKGLEDYDGSRDEDDVTMYLDLKRIFINLIECGMRKFWHKRSCFTIEPLTGCNHKPFITWIQHRLGTRKHSDDKMMVACYAWNKICAYCGNQEKEKLKFCGRCKSFCYCSKECQVKHWRAGHKVDCKGHWIEFFFPKLRTPSKISWTKLF